MGSLINEVLRSVADGEELRALEPGASAFASRLDQDSTSRSALALAQLVREIARAGEREAQACQAILESFAEYLRGRQATGGR
jgi:hypothetical protein